jgi:hypothetical protein
LKSAGGCGSGWLGAIKVDLIVVDTLERLGRAEEIEGIRRKLRVEYGVLVVEADNDFADPTGMVGKAVNMVEQIRSTEDGRIKAHNVTRGEKDTVRRKRFAGGPTPFGYCRKQLVDESGREPQVYTILEPELATAGIIQKIFAKAYETGWAGTRLAKYFNADPDRGENCTDVFNDARVIEANPHPEEVVRVEGFCPPLITKDVFDGIRAVKEARKKARASLVAATDAVAQKLIEPIAARFLPPASCLKCHKMSQNVPLFACFTLPKLPRQPILPAGCPGPIW